MTIVAERRERRSRLGAVATEQGLDGVFVFSWRRQTLRWLTGYWPGYVTNWGAAWIGVDEEVELGVRFPFEVERAARESGLPARCIPEPQDLIPQSVSRVGLLGGDFAIDETPPAVLQALRDREVDAVDLRWLVSTWRTLKSGSEIDAHRRAAAVASGAVDAIGVPEPGTTDLEVAARVEGFARRAGAERALCLVGVRRGEVITEAHGRVIARDQPVGLEITLHLSDACTHVCVTLPPPSPSADDDLAISACRSARAAILAALRPGADVASAVQAGDRVLHDLGLLDAKEYDFGHGIGRTSRSYPAWSREPRRAVVTAWSSPFTPACGHGAGRRPSSADRSSSNRTDHTSWPTSPIHPGSHEIRHVPGRCCAQPRASREQERLGGKPSPRTR